MAKELPYFKFYPGEFLTGDITICSEQAQGVFINICCHYWMKQGSISLANVKQRFSKQNDMLEELLKSDILKINSEGKIIIEFLDEQILEFLEISEKLAKSGKVGGQANAKQMLSKSEAKSSNKDKIREDIIYKYSSFYDSEILKSEQQNNIEYAKFVEWLFKNNINKRPLTKVLNMKDQITVEMFDKYMKLYGYEKIKDTIINLDNYTKKTYSSFNSTLNNWLKPKDKK